ncbi:nitrilase-related carbon-nitrogen hydrolase [Streptosporangium sp. NPDC051023]|uniref:nitrilase-related carbon-nitrogen hydrolase n=1 Tax=Streptosporangium sp. NPDC051023 TaxID=3155410 RepID=UPI00344FF03A
MKSWKLAVAAGLSAVLFALGTGLHPIWFLTWLAPLPVLLAAARVRFRLALAAAFAAFAAGQAPLWLYFLNVVEIPLPLMAALMLGLALVFALLAAASGALVRRGRPLSAVVLPSAGWAATEYLLSVLGPYGAWWSLGYTQADVLPVLQAVSLTGVWGVTFLLLAVPSAAAVLLSGTVGRLRVALVVWVVLVAVLGYGAWQLRAPEPGARVALLVTDHPNDAIPLDTAQGRTLVARYAEQVEALAARGVRTVVLPEKTFLADDRTLPMLASALTRITARHRVDVVAGLVLRRGDVLTNVALGYPAGGGRPSEYTKHFLIPGLESELTPGSGLTVLPGGSGLIICKDLDYPGLVRSYREAGATVLYAPAWDFSTDGWLHGRMALVRGVESGVTVARAARAGRLVISDPAGRVVAETESSSADFATAIAPLPAAVAPTLYARVGDWFAWLCLGLTAVSLIAGFRVRRTPQPEPEPRIPVDVKS